MSQNETNVFWHLMSNVSKPVKNYLHPLISSITFETVRKTLSYNVSSKEFSKYSHTSQRTIQCC